VLGTSAMTMKSAKFIGEGPTAPGHVIEMALASARAISGVNFTLRIALMHLASSLSTVFTEHIILVSVQFAS
jgi:hypothetical protein